MAIVENLDMKNVLEKLENLVEIMENFSELAFDKNFLVVDKEAILTQCIINSATLTGKSIVSCCKNGCIADANVLARKYRDDIFFFLYIICYERLIATEPDNKEGIEAMERNILLWNNNMLSGLNIKVILKSISEISVLKYPVVKYKLKDTFNEIGKQLNNFMHGNGKKYYNYYLWKGVQENYIKQLNTLIDDLNYITIVFLFLLVLCAPQYIAASDYVDYLECGCTPIEGSQYWVAPFIEQFIKENITLIDEACYSYLKENTCMEI